MKQNLTKNKQTFLKKQTNERTNKQTKQNKQNKQNKLTYIANHCEKTRPCWRCKAFYIVSHESVNIVKSSASFGELTPFW